MMVRGINRGCGCRKCISYADGGCALSFLLPFVRIFTSYERLEIGFLVRVAAQQELSARQSCIHNCHYVIVA